MTLRSILVDDEIHNLENLEHLIKNHCPMVSVIAKAASVDEAILLISTHRPDLVFLDIEMPHKNGFDLLDEVSEIDFEVIFVTAYDQYALKAVKSCALDYLLKPINTFELVSAVNKVHGHILEKRENQKLKLLVQNLKNINEPNKIALPTAEELYFVSVTDIVRCKGENNYTLFFLSDERTILVSRTLKEWDDLLSEHGFIRTHQSHLVNSIHVQSFVKKDGGYILMKDGSTVCVSKHKKENTLRALATLR
ncbi:MAG: LytTR family DNA-binding domain-containing protein [Flavobacteriaceae bacterium]